MKKITLLFLLLTLSFSINAQFTEGFESGIPDDWTVINNGGANGWVQNTAPTDGASEGSAVASITYNSSAHDDYLITPAIAVSVGVNESLSFNVKSRSSSYLEEYEVLLSTTNPSEAEFSVVLQASSDAPNAWSKIVFDLSAYDGQSVYVAIRATDTDRFALYVDDVTSGIEVAVPECTTTPSPVIGATDVEINTATASVNIGWEAPASGPAPTGYEIFWGETSGSLTSIGTIAETSVSITNVNYNTTYYWMAVPTNAGGSAEGCAEWSFTTDPIANPDYLNPFTVYPGAGWAEATGPINEPTGTSSSFIQDDFGNDTTHANGKSARINIYGEGVDEYLVTTKFDLSGGTYYLNFDIALTLYGNSNASALDPDDYLALLVTQDDGASWTELARWDETSTLTPEGAATDELTLSGYNNDTYFAFYAFSDTSGVDNDLFIDNFQVTASSLTAPSAPTADAPTPPARQAGDVVSVYSDAYTNINVTNFNPGWGQTGAVDAAYDPTGAGTNTVLEYSNFNYQGTEFDATDASAMEFVHIDIWTADATDVKFSPINNGTGTTEVLVNVPLVTGEWSSVDIAIADFTGMTWDSLFQMKFDGGAGVNPSTIYIDNVYFWKNPTTAPTTNAPTPPAREAGDVISIYSDAYATNQPTVHNSTFDKIAKSSGSDCACSGWINKDIADQGESSTTEGSDVVKLDDFESDGIYQEIAVQANSNYTLDLDFKYEVDPSTTEHIEVLILKGSSYVSGYTPAYAAPDTAAQDGFGYQEVSAVDDTNNHVSSLLITHPGDTSLNPMTQLSFNTGSETSIAIFIRAVGPYDAASHGDSGKDKGWMNGDAEVRLDNLSLVNQGVHTNANVTNFNPGWGQTGAVDAAYDPTGAGNNTVLEYSNFNYQGTEFDAIDASAMEFVHIDIWTADATDVKFSPINNGTGAGEFLVNVPLVTGGWSSVDIAIADFTGMTWDSLFQMKFDGAAGVNPSTIYIDNVYFYKEAVQPVTAPTTDAPTPPARETGDVISIYSDAYTNINVTNFNPGWGQTGAVDAAYDPTGAGTNTVLEYSNFNYQGTEFDATDASAMEFVHIDIWTANATDVKFSPINNGTGAGEFLVSVPVVTGEWSSVDIAIADFTGMTWDSLFQMKFDGQGGVNPSAIYIDNVYFYKEPSATSDVIFITELADPNDNAAARYVEIYNGGTSAVDLTGWTLRRYTNGNADPQTTGEDLSPIGSLAPGAIAIIAANGTAFEAAFGMAADISAGTGGPADSNGDDQIYITDASDTIVDFFGVAGEDGSGTDHEFEDGRAERKASVTQGTATWDVSEWNIDNDGGAGDGALNVDGGFDPGVWIGAETAGVEDESLVTLNMYPNPASDVLNISAQNTINTVEIYNVLGQKVISMQVENTSAEINVSNLNAGIYLIKYEINNSTSTKKFVKN